jgi:hypothetical protein
LKRDETVEGPPLDDMLSSVRVDPGQLSAPFTRNGHVKRAPNRLADPQEERAT